MRLEPFGTSGAKSVMESTVDGFPKLRIVQLSGLW